MENRTYLTLLELRQDLFDFSKAQDDPRIHFDDLMEIFNKFVDRETPKNINDYKRELGLSYANENLDFTMMGDKC